MTSDLTYKSRGARALIGWLFDSFRVHFGTLVTRARAAFAVCLGMMVTIGCQGPTDIVHAPSPVGHRADSRQPLLRASLADSGNSAACFFQVAPDSGFADPIESGPVTPERATVVWQVPVDLDVGQTYFWRVGVADGSSYRWDTVVSFVGGPPLHASPNPFCCKEAKIHKRVTIRGIVPPAQLQVVSQNGDVVHRADQISESQHVWPVTDQQGNRVEGTFIIEVEDQVGQHEIALPVTW